MVYTVSITSQGQMSIPVKLRRALNLDKMKKALVTLEGGKIIVEPVGDILDLKGSVKSNKPPLSNEELHELFGQSLIENRIIK